MRATATVVRLFAATALCITIASPAFAANNGLESADGTIVNNPSGSTIQGDLNGIYSYGTSFNLNNFGMIRGDGTTGGVSFSNGGVVVTAGPANVQNYGTISGAQFGITTLPFNGTEGRALRSEVYNYSIGSIIGDNDDGVRLQGGGYVYNEGYIAGRVGSGADGVSIFPFADQDTTGLVFGGGEIYNQDGVIEGNRDGIIISGGGLVYNETGTVTGIGRGIVIQTQANDPGRYGLVSNGGTVNGGISYLSLASGYLANTGVISATSGSGVLGSGTNSGQLNIENDSAGSITGSTDGIHSDGTSLDLINYGTIRGNGGTGGVVTSNGGVVVTGGPATITNNGSISGARFGITTLPFNGSTGMATFSQVTNNATGTIIGDNEDGVRLMGGGTVTNSGYIAGRLASGADGVSIFPYASQIATGATFGTLTNLASGIIDGFRFGAILSGGGTLDNAGTISGGATSSGLRGAVQIQGGDSTQTAVLNNSGSLNGNVRLIGLGNSTITNSGVINGSSTGSALLTDSAMTLTNSLTATIHGVAASGVFSSGASLTLDNEGSIRGDGVSTDFNAPAAGVLFTGGAGNVTNSGSISGGTFGVSTFYFQLSSGTNDFQGRAFFSSVDNSGTIIGDHDDGVRLIGGGSVTNSGYIAGRLGTAADGVSIFPYNDQNTAGLTGVGSVTNTAAGVIEGNRAGIILSGGGTINNAGSITGNTFGAVIQTQATDHGRTGTITNSGNITGVVGFFSLDSGTLNNSGAIFSWADPAVQANGPLTVNNSGLISATNPIAVQMSEFADTFTILPDSTIVGAVDAAAGTDTLRLSGVSATPTASETLGVFSGTFMNFENLNVVGGYWTVPGGFGAFNSTTVTGGTLAINGSITSPVTVNPGAALAGLGSITGNVGVNGSVNAGGSAIGTLTINGGLTLGATSTFNVNTNPNGTSDRLVVNGAVTINNGATLQVLAGIATYPSTTTSYTVLTATGGITGKYDKPLKDYAYYNASVNVQKKGTITLNLTPNGKPLPSAATPLTFSAATAVEALGGTNPLYQALLGQSVGGARQAFTALSGSAYGSLGAQLADGLGDVRPGLVSSSSDAPALEWSGVRSITSKSFSTQSAVRRGKLSLFMVGGRYANRISTDGATAEADTRFLTSAVGYRAGRFQALAGATTAWHDLMVSRSVDFPGFSDSAGSRYVARTTRLEAEADYALTNGPIGITPYLAYAMTRLSMPAFQESGGLSALSFDRSSQSIGQLKLGVRAGARFETGGGAISPHVDVALQRNRGDLAWVGSARFAASQSSFDSIAASLGRQSLAMDAGVDFNSGPLTISGRYRGRFGSAQTDHLAEISAGFRF